MSVVSELGIKDKWGTNVGDYQVQYDVGLLDMVGHGLALIVTIIYATLVQPLGALSAGLLNQIANPKKYLGMLEDAYTWLLKPVFSLASPMTIALGVASLVMLVMFFRRSTLMSQPNGQLMQNALSSYFVIIFATWLLMNPFKLLRWAFETLEGVLNDLTQGMTASSSDGSMTAHYLTTVTQLINFGGVLNDSAGGAWSQALRAGRDLKDVPQLADQISKVNPGSIFSALTAGGAGVAMLVFSIVCFFYMVFYLFELAYRTAAVPFFMYYGAYNFRRMDLIWHTLGRIASYFGMTAIVALCAVAGPVLATGIIADLFGNKFAFLQIVTSIFVYALMSWMMVKFLKPNGRVAEFMRLHGKNQWRGYMQRSAILMATDKAMQYSSKAAGLTDKAMRKVLQTTTGITVPDSVPTPMSMQAKALEGNSHKAGEAVSNALPPGKENKMKAIEAVPASARETAFDAAESAKSVPAVGSSSKLKAISQVAKSVSGGESKELPLSGGGAAGGSPTGGGASAALGAVAGALGSGKKSTEQGEDEPDTPEIIDGEVVSVDDVPDVGTRNSLNFPEAGDEDGVAQYQMQYMGSTGQFDDAENKSTGMDGTAMVGHDPMPLTEPGVVDDEADARAHERMEQAAQPMFYAAGDEEGATAVEMMDPRVPLTEDMRAEIDADPARDFADQDAVKDMALPSGVEVFGGRAVWTNPETEGMAALTAPVADGVEDTVTRAAMMDHADSIADPRLREIFIVQHGLDRSVDDVADDEAVDDVVSEETETDDTAASTSSTPGADVANSSVDVPESVMVSGQDEPVHTVGEGFVDDDVTVSADNITDTPDTSLQMETSEISDTSSFAESSTATPASHMQGEPQPEQTQPEQTQQPQPEQKAQPEQTEHPQQPEQSQPEHPPAAPALSARSVDKDAAKRMQREYTESVRATERGEDTATKPEVSYVQPAAEPERAPEPKPAKPADYKKDLEVLNRRESAGRAGSSSTAETGTGRGSVDIPRSQVAAADATPIVENLAASSVESVTAVTSREDVFEQSRLISSAMGTGGVTPVPDDDPSLSHTFMVVDGENVVQSGTGLSGGMTW